MKKIKIQLLVILIFGICFGLYRWISIYESYTDKTRFRALSGTEMRLTVAWLVEHRSFVEIKKFLLSVYPQEEPNSHAAGHLLGEEAYRVYKEKAFSMCDPMFNYGCYHGVVDKAIRINGPKAHIVFDLKRACDTHLVDAGPCIHPLGHASTTVSNYNVISAFELCDRLYPDPNVAFSCWNGAMMEYINRSAPNAPQFLYGKALDPYYPCNTFPAKYESSCVSMHMSYLMQLWGRDYDKIFAHCHSYTSEQTRNHCIDAVGSLIGLQYFNDTQSIVTTCSKASPDSAVCIRGAVVPLGAAKQFLITDKLCGMVETDALKQMCYTSAGMNGPLK